MIRGFIRITRFTRLFPLSPICRTVLRLVVLRYTMHTDQSVYILLQQTSVNAASRTYIIKTHYRMMKHDECPLSADRPTQR